MPTDTIEVCIDGYVISLDETYRFSGEGSIAMACPAFVQGFAPR